jgi:hypothetical protein
LFVFAVTIDSNNDDTNMTHNELWFHYVYK